MDNSNCPSRSFIRKDGSVLFLVNVNDKIYNDYVKYWRFPSDYSKVTLSRNIKLRNRQVTNVDVVYDDTVSEYSDITDSYLRNALMRNKNNLSIEGIIQTIQKKQDYIRTLPIDKSFIVQGCAGSGKTMVLLHRLKYLIFNNELKNDNYILLIPGNNFKEFINELTGKFNISKSNIFSFFEYFKYFSGREEMNIDVLDELNFDRNYLEYVYSTKLIKKCYADFFDSLILQSEQLISFCDEYLSDLSQKGISKIEESILDINNKVIKDINNSLYKLKEFYKINDIENIEDAENVLKFLNEEYVLKQREINDFRLPKHKLTISDNDVRLINDEMLIMIKKQIKLELINLEKSSRFTKKSHETKLEQLDNKYKERKEIVIQEILMENDTKRKDTILLLIFEINQIVVKELKDTIEKIKNILNIRDEKLKNYEDKMASFTENFDKKYENQIKILTNFIESTIDYSDNAEMSITELKPLSSYIYKIIELGKDLIISFNLSSHDEWEKINNDFKFFIERTESQQSNYLYTFLFNRCKKYIKEIYDIKISNRYKHYWYLNTYFKFLTNNINKERKKYIFIDEAQDLGVNEIRLINKINCNENPDGSTNHLVFNLYGDIHQTISLHGIKNWNELKSNIDIYILNENFRNANQIVDYCNQILPFKMVKIGVDMEQVSFIESLSAAIKYSTSIKNSPIFIVKDDYAKLDLMTLLEKNCNLFNISIYTVKEVKGLEFKEVYVFNRDMTDNEMYIAYTRALIKLNIIKKLPYQTKKTNLIIEEDEENDYVLTEKNIVLNSDNSIIEDKFKTNEKNSSIQESDGKKNTDKIKEEINIADKSKGKGKLITLQGRINGKFYLISYNGKLKKYCNKKIPNMFIPISKNNKEMLIPISIDEDDKIVYIMQSTYKAYEKYFLENDIFEIRKNYSN